MPNDNSDEDRLREWIQMEVAKQLEPFGKVLEEIQDWQYDFYANGSGRRLGIFQERMKEDDVYRLKVEKELERQNIKVEDQAGKIDNLFNMKLEEKAIRDYRAKLWAFWWPILKWTLMTGIPSTVLAIVLYAPKVYHVGHVIWEDYLKSHPAVTKEIKTSTETNPAVQSKPDPPQNAGGPAIHY